MKVYDGVFNMSCGHEIKFKGFTKQGAEEVRKTMYEQQGDLCRKCYAEHCEEWGITPWYSVRQEGA